LKALPTIRHSVARTFASDLILATLILFGLASCRSEPTSTDTRISFGTSIRVIELILNEITGEVGRVHTLISDSQSPHAFHPKPSDVERLARSSVLFLASPDLDGWAAELVDSEPVYLSELMQADDWLIENSSRNPHFWTDPVIVAHLLRPLTDILCSIDKANCLNFEQNASRFSQDLEELDSRIRSLLDPLAETCMVATQPFFNYFLARYGIDLAGTLETVPGHEPTASQIVKTLDLVSSRGCIGIVAQTRLPASSARLFAGESGLSIAYLDPVGSKNHSTYGELILRNSEILLRLAFKMP